MSLTSLLTFVATLCVVTPPHNTLPMRPRPERPQLARPDRTNVDFRDDVSVSLRLGSGKKSRPAFMASSTQLNRWLSGGISTGESGSKDVMTSYDRDAMTSYDQRNPPDTHDHSSGRRVSTDELRASLAAAGDSVSSGVEEGAGWPVWLVGSELYDVWQPYGKKKLSSPVTTTTTTESPSSAVSRSTTSGPTISTATTTVSPAREVMATSTTSTSLVETALADPAAPQNSMSNYFHTEDNSPTVSEAVTASPQEPSSPPLPSVLVESTSTTLPHSKTGTALLEAYSTESDAECVTCSRGLTEDNISSKENTEVDLSTRHTSMDDENKKAVGNTSNETSLIPGDNAVENTDLEQATANASTSDEQEHTKVSTIHTEPSATDSIIQPPSEGADSESFGETSNHEDETSSTSDSIRVPTVFFNMPEEIKSKGSSENGTDIFPPLLPIPSSGTIPLYGEDPYIASSNSSEDLQTDVEESNGFWDPARDSFLIESVDSTSTRDTSFYVEPDTGSTKDTFYKEPYMGVIDDGSFHGIHDSDHYYEFVESQLMPDAWYNTFSDPSNADEGDYPLIEADVDDFLHPPEPVAIDRASHGFHIERASEDHVSSPLAHRLYDRVEMTADSHLVDSYPATATLSTDIPQGTGSS